MASNTVGYFEDNITCYAPQYGVSNINFTGNPGVYNELVENNVPLDLFELMFTDEICKYIADMTNKYAEDTMANKVLKPRSRMERWKLVSMEDIKIYAAVVMFQGIIWKPTYEMYYTSNL